MIVVWFGINLGLKPLTDLQDAISIRSSDDLSQIRRPVPPEVSGVLTTLNNLFDQLQSAIASRDRFISDAAHQLRNPVAGLLSLAEATRDAKSAEDQSARVLELVDAAHYTSRLSHQLLSLERAKGHKDLSRFKQLNLNEVVREVCEQNANHILERDIEFEFIPHRHDTEIKGDELLLKEALQNLIDNALKHAGSNNKRIDVGVMVSNEMAYIYVADQGVGLSCKDSQVAFSRFAQVRPGEGSGLGLAIVEEIARLHGGSAQIESSEHGAKVSINMPVAASST